ncbi:hypothetical protein Q4553_01415 [Tenacibaculum soleae]|uniref:hypothetical protein n=1 Tax=Tenacibaculum soleae TaxID=447689 RepID=UPI0026E494FD|nr:hypothetical protein [Tenacibaculum soleae]MDO6743224.1 hypothetical protein [Tenacibaculum soleae]
MRKLISFIQKNISGKKVLLLFVLTNLIYALMLTITIPGTMKFSNGMKLLDMMPTGYDYNYVTELFTSLGDVGRKTYLTNQLPVDMIYPFLFGISYCLLSGYFLKKINRLKKPFIYLCLLPLITGLFDYLENFGIIVMLNNYTEITPLLVKITSAFTIIKSITTSAYFISLVVLFIVFTAKKINKKTS